MHLVFLVPFRSRPSSSAFTQVNHLWLYSDDSTHCCNTPGTKGIDVLEHLERLDAVEASLQRLGVDEYDDEEEVDVGESSSTTKPIQVPRRQASSPSASSAMATSPFSPPGSPPLPTVPEVPSATSSDAEEEDVAMLSKSMSQVQDHHQRWASAGGQGSEWMSSGETAAKRTVIVEVRFPTQVQFPG
jgi:hypothetical protein